MVVQECVEAAKLEYGEDESEVWVDTDSIRAVSEMIK
jgi:hypothetical protein